MNAGRGFTLIELMVVLAILAFVATVATPRLLRALPGAELRAGAHDIQGGLREARGLAIARNEEVTFTLDGTRRRFSIQPGNVGRRLPEDVHISLITAREEVLDDARGSIRFFPDGTSTGGRITLSTNGRSAVIETDWLTGRVSLVD